MSRAARKKDDRIDIRIDDHDKNLIERAASIVGMSVSSFTLFTTLRAAKEQIMEHERLSFSDKDRDLFLATILNPPKANKALRTAMMRAKKERG